MLPNDINATLKYKYLLVRLGTQCYQFTTANARCNNYVQLKEKFLEKYQLSDTTILCELESLRYDNDLPELHK